MSGNPGAAYDVALVLGGGNALGAYHAGVYQALHEQGVEPRWIVGASIGAVNGAIIAGNAPDVRLSRLAGLWRPEEPGGWPVPWDTIPESWRRTGAVLGTLLGGRPGVFNPIGTALGNAFGSSALYDSHPLTATLDALVDFPALNGGAPRFTATALDLVSGEDLAFDTAAGPVVADHIRGSAALPTSFPAVEIEGRLVVDGGLSANLPLDPVLSAPGDRPLLCIAVDLLPLAGHRPHTLGETAARLQDLVFAAQSRRSIARWTAAYRADEALSAASVTLVRLAYRDQEQEVAGKAMDFSPRSVRARWDAGHRDAVAMFEALADGRIVTGRQGLTVIA